MQTLGERIRALRDDATGLIEEVQAGGSDQTGIDGETDVDNALSGLEAVRDLPDPPAALAAIEVEPRHQSKGGAPLNRARDLGDEVKAIRDVLDSRGVEDDGGWLEEFSEAANWFNEF